MQLKHESSDMNSRPGEDELARTWCMLRIFGTGWKRIGSARGILFTYLNILEFLWVLESCSASQPNLYRSSAFWIKYLPRKTARSACLLSNPPAASWAPANKNFGNYLDKKNTTNIQ